jgi:preprotein translocase subunit SecF
VPIQIVPPDINLNFIGHWRLAVALSAALLAVALAGALLRGVRFGIDFAGGTEIHIRLSAGDVDEGPIRQVVSASGVNDPSVVRFGAAEQLEFLIRFASESLETLEAQLPPVSAEGEAGTNETAGASEASTREASGEAAPEEEQAESATTAAREDLPQGDWVQRLRDALTASFGPVEILRVDFVGPRVGGELRRDGLKALTYACALILIYIGFRFTLRFAPGAVLALVHDILVTAGIWVLLGKEFNLQVLAALLAILGYSLNDTIILYDRIWSCAPRKISPRCSTAASTRPSPGRC